MSLRRPKACGNLREVSGRTDFLEIATSDFREILLAMTAKEVSWYYLMTSLSHSRVHSTMCLPVSALASLADWANHSVLRSQRLRSTSSG